MMKDEIPSLERTRHTQKEGHDTFIRKEHSDMTRSIDRKKRLLERTDQTGYFSGFRAQEVSLKNLAFWDWGIGFKVWGSRFRKFRRSILSSGSWGIFFCLGFKSVGSGAPRNQGLGFKGQREREKEFFIDNLLVRIHLTIEMIIVDRRYVMGV